MLLEHHNLTSNMVLPPHSPCTDHTHRSQMAVSRFRARSTQRFRDAGASRVISVICRTARRGLLCLDTTLNLFIGPPPAPSPYCSFAAARIDSVNWMSTVHLLCIRSDHSWQLYAPLSLVQLRYHILTPWSSYITLSAMQHHA
jgi:hypothetical protein